MNLEKAREAYQHDPQYKCLVDLLVNQIETLNMTPSEVREVAMFACLIHEERRPPSAMSTFPTCKKCHVAVGPGHDLCAQCAIG